MSAEEGSAPPKRSISRLSQLQNREVAEPGQPPVRRPSVLARLGVAPLDVNPLGRGEREFDPSEMPPRSPTAVRSHSSLKIREAGEKFLERKRKEEEERERLAKEPTVAVPVEAPVDTPWHTMDIDKMFAELGTRRDGLTTAEAEEHAVKYGLNQMEQPPRQSLLSKFLHNFLSPFSTMLLLASALCAIITGVSTSDKGKIDIQSLALCIALFSVVLITSSFQTWMEYQADGLLEALLSLTADKAWVFRDGNLQLLPAKLLVPGDIIRVEVGEKVPADVRILEANALKVNNSSLTGETRDITLGPEARKPQLFEALNIARSGCCFTNGHGIAIVFATGSNTFFGQIAKAAVTAERPDTLMRREVRRLVLIMGVIGTLTGFAFFAAAFGLKKGWMTAIVTLVGLFVANIPEGLMPQITLALTITASRMKKENVVVSNLEIIETLGAVSTICSDKTGTLTLNIMTVAHVVYDKIIHMTESCPVQPGDEVHPVDSASHTVLHKILRVIALCSEVTFLSKDPATHPRTWPKKGDASEGGLLVFHQELEDIDEARKAGQRLAVLPFSSANKYMISIVRFAPNKHAVLMKGAAERIVARCSTMLHHDGTETPLTEADKAHLNSIIEKLAERGERVLGFAQKEMDVDNDDFVYDVDEGNFPTDDLTFLGLVAMVDPPRPSVPRAIQDCTNAGIHVIMITGDHPSTAVAIARAIGLVTKPLITEAPRGTPPQECSIVVTGDQLTHYTQEDWDIALSCSEHVFARTQPQHKQDIVYRLQERGQIVAMTGDGVNDAPALKAANVGVCVASGTTVAKEAAHLIIDDDFNSIVVGIKEGRTIFDNLKKATVFVLSHLLPEIIPFVLNFALEIPLAMETIVILLVDLGTDLPPSVCLAYEHAEPRVMQIPPRTADDHLIRPRMLVLSYLVAGTVELFFGFWTYFFIFYEHGFSFSSLRGASEGYRDTYVDLDDKLKIYYQGLCSGTQKYIDDSGAGSAAAACGTDAAMNVFMEHFNKVVSEAQAGYFITFAAMQLMYVFCYRHQTMSLFSPHQTLNWRLFFASALSVGIMCFFVYVPGLNEAFFLTGAGPKKVCAGLWGIPFILALEETRKWWVRTWPEGRFAQISLF